MAVAVVALLLSILALLLIIFDGACRPDPVPAAQPVDAQPTTQQFKSSDPGEVAP